MPEANVMHLSLKRQLCSSIYCVWDPEKRNMSPYAEGSALPPMRPLLPQYQSLQFPRYRNKGISLIRFHVYLFWLVSVIQLWVVTHFNWNMTNTNTHVRGTPLVVNISRMDKPSFWPRVWRRCLYSLCRPCPSIANCLDIPPYGHDWCRLQGQGCGVVKFLYLKTKRFEHKCSTCRSKENVTY